MNVLDLSQLAVSSGSSHLSLRLFMSLVALVFTVFKLAPPDSAHMQALS